MVFDESSSSTFDHDCASVAAAQELPRFAWRGPAIGLLDLDAFFASVEQLDHPQWRGKPVIVGGDSNRRGVVSTASYEARAFGVHSAMASAQAERLCPQAIWTPGRHERYREVSRQVMALIEAETPLVEQVSIDEAFFDITPGRYSNEHPMAIARRIQEAVAALGVTCSIGLGTTKSVAKIASEREKPRGLTCVPPGTEHLFLDPLPVRALSGVGSATEKTLHSEGIFTLGQLALANTDMLRRLLGVQGPMLQARAQGTEASPVVPPDLKGPAKSVSNERTFATDLHSAKDVEAAVRSVASMVGSRLRTAHLAGSEVTLKLKFDFGQGRSAQKRLACCTDDEAVFGAAAIELLHETWYPGIAVRLVGVGVSRFGEIPAPEAQPSLFDVASLEGASLSATRRSEAVSKIEAAETRAQDIEAQRKLHVAADSIRQRFGDGAIAYGRDLRLKEQTVKGTDPRPQDEGLL